MTQSRWHIESLRATAFSSSLSGTEDYDWWETFVDAVPTNKNAFPAETRIQVTGKFESGQLLLALQRGRMRSI